MKGNVETNLLDLLVDAEEGNDLETLFIIRLLLSLYR